MERMAALHNVQCAAALSPESRMKIAPPYTADSANDKILA